MTLKYALKTKSRLGFLVVFIIFCAFCVRAESNDTGDGFTDSIFYKGDVAFRLEKDAYNAGDELKVKITASNMENFPLPPAALVIELVEGGSERVYPSHMSDKDNVFYEEVIGNIGLGPMAQKEAEFSYRLPEDMKSGTYRLEVYLRTEREPIVGIPHLFLAPRYQVFNVSGQGLFPYARIRRTATLFGNESGQIGSPVGVNEMVKGLVYLESEKPLSEHVLEITVCPWDDTACASGDVYLRKDYLIESSVSRVDVELQAPGKPNAYAVRIELKDETGRTVSLYRGRLIVMGETARIRKLVVDRAYYANDAEGSIKALIGPSPDHYSYPVVSNAKLTLSLRAGGRELYSKSFTLPELSIDKGLSYKNVGFKAPQELGEFELCGQVESEAGELFDEYCYAIRSAETPSSLEEGEVTAEWTYDKEDKSVLIRLCAGNDKTPASSTRTAVILLGKEDRIPSGFQENLELDPCKEAVFRLAGGDYVLLVNDLVRNKQYSFGLSVPAEEASAPTTAPPSPSVTLPSICSDAVCGPEESTDTCCTDCGCPVNQECGANGCRAKDAGNEYLLAALVGVSVLAVLALSRLRKKK